MKANFFVIIATYNAMKWAERCFGSLRRSSLPVKIIVVDNGSTDGTQDFIKKNFPEVEFIQSEENLGFGKANNIGIEKAYKQGAEFFYLMNQDAWIFEDSFEKLLEVYENHPHKEEIGILSPMHLDGSELRLDPHFEMYLARESTSTRVLSDLFFNRPENTYPSKFINAAHWLLPKTTIENVGGFNPYFFHGAEDHDYVNRVHFHGLKVFFTTHSKVVHDARPLIDESRSAEKIRKDTADGLRLRTETRYLDPNFSFDINTAKKEFRNDVIKLLLKGKRYESDIYAEVYKKLRPQMNKFAKLRKISETNTHAFLKL